MTHPWHQKLGLLQCDCNCLTVEEMYGISGKSSHKSTILRRRVSSSYTIPLIQKKNIWNNFRNNPESTVDHLTMVINSPLAVDVKTMVCVVDFQRLKKIISWKDDCSLYGLSAVIHTGHPKKKQVSMVYDFNSNQRIPIKYKSNCWLMGICINKSVVNFAFFM